MSLGKCHVNGPSCQTKNTSHATQYRCRNCRQVGCWNCIGGSCKICNSTAGADPHKTLRVARSRVSGGRLAADVRRSRRGNCGCLNAINRAE